MKICNVKWHYLLFFTSCQHYDVGAFSNLVYKIEFEIMFTVKRSYWLRFKLL